jgi:hypothetical protein
MTKTEVSRRVKGEVTPIKSQLLRLLCKLESDGLAKDARRLGNIIANLEDWQNCN